MDKQKRKNENRLPFYRFLFYGQTKRKKAKNENRLPFYLFSFYGQTKTKIDFRFIFFRFMDKQKQKSTSVFIVLRFMQVHLRCHGVGVGGSRGRLRPIYIWVGEVVAKLAGCCKL